MSTVKDLKAKVINTLNILSGQDITETKLYKSILSANEYEKKLLIMLSASFAGTFSTFGKSLETINIYAWLEILFDRFKTEEGIDIKNTLPNNSAATSYGNFSFEEFAKLTDAIKEIKESRYRAFEYAAAFGIYNYKEIPNIERIAKIIQPLEMFILTAITAMTILCQIDQRPFEHYANMDLKSIEDILLKEYCPLNSRIFEEFLKYDDDQINKNILIQYTVLDLLVNGNYSEEFKNHIEHALNGKMMDKAFAKLINVSEKSEYEKLKSLYKK